jgi:peptide deformylase
MILDILHHPDDRLRAISKHVTSFDTDLMALVENMAETMYVANGVGLAAPQVGISSRIFIVDIDEGRDLRIFINPNIVDHRGSSLHDEGCLSLPGAKEMIKRPSFIRLNALNVKGESFEIEADGFLARVIQHELDHLDGILMIDRKKKIKLKNR